MKTMKTGTEMPKARRRHCGCFIGSSLVVFGGFNGEYFNDLHYINTFEVRSKIVGGVRTGVDQKVLDYLNNVKSYDYKIATTDDLHVYINKGFIANKFRSVK